MDFFDTSKAVGHIASRAVKESSDRNIKRLNQDHHRSLGIDRSNTGCSEEAHS